MISSFEILTFADNLKTVLSGALRNVENAVSFAIDIGGSLTKGGSKYFFEIFCVEFFKDYFSRFFKADFIASEVGFSNNDSDRLNHFLKSSLKVSIIFECVEIDKKKCCDLIFESRKSWPTTRQ